MGFKIRRKNERLIRAVSHHKDLNSDPFKIMVYEINSEWQIEPVEVGEGLEPIVNTLCRRARSRSAIPPRALVQHMANYALGGEQPREAAQDTRLRERRAHVDRRRSGARGSYSYHILDNLYIETSCRPLRRMLFLQIDVQAPTSVIWWSLFHYYMFLGFAAGTIVTAYISTGS